MEENLLADRIANAIMMDKSFSGYYLLVEGIKDYKLFSKFIYQKNIRIKEAFGVEKVQNVLKILSERNYAEHLAIIDSDFANILDSVEEVDGLFLTDYHDTEVMIFNTKALDSILRMFVSSSKIIAFEKKHNKRIKDAIFELGSEVGFLKLANKIYGLGLVFKPATVDGNQIKYKDFIDDKEFTFKGHQALVTSLLNYSRSKSVTKSEKEILESLKIVSSSKYDVNQLVNGHDLSNILFLLMKKVFASNNKMLHDFNSIEDSLTLAYEYEDFKATDLYKNILAFGQLRKVQIFR